MNTFLQCLGRVFKGLFGFAGEVLHRVLGWLGGLVCALSASLVVFYCLRVFHLHWLLFIGAVLAFLVVFSLLGLLLPRYFACFFFPVLVILGSGGEAGAHDAAGPNTSREEWLAMFGTVTLAGAMLGLAAGALFQFHLCFYMGVAGFSTFAVMAPMIFTSPRKEK